MRTLLVGCGNMGRALLDGWLAARVLAPAEVTVLDPLATPPEGVAIVREPPAARFDLVVLAIKPQQFGELAPDLAPLADGALVLSILAGTSCAQLAAGLPGARVARIMANLAAAFGQSPVALFASPGILSEPDRVLLDRLGGALGELQWLTNEEQFHAFIALGGSGPGFVYRLLEAFAKGGAELGIEPGASAAMALAMVRGAGELAARSGADFGELAARVASPGGTTRAGLDELERDGAADRLVAATLRAARDRSAEMARSG
ncbi:pyrroline-5-carboxylate reductase [Novosphingobium sp. Gsoil 351]|uniref:pyrroline-5-carboxylate reductase family protein n=1 Tax=Novosphingobium sp. Gsoil 351 TaxID=2675225 RepID=UPI0012B4BAE6|nr:pyrroline-5-carboxylate reductase [Novosphingobium sp. Gsoil 351]QGN55581.1 pyrroline-5-carboxylate reductase [Novosphingobium sp. Gsoil 351]